MATPTYQIALSMTISTKTNHSFPQLFTSRPGAWAALEQEAKALVPPHLAKTAESFNLDGSCTFKFENHDTMEWVEVEGSVVQTGN